MLLTRSCNSENNHPIQSKMSLDMIIKESLMVSVSLEGHWVKYKCTY